MRASLLRRRRTWAWRLAILVMVALASGCGTTRMTDTQRTATEQLLVSHAVDGAVSHLDFSALAGKTVFFDAQYLDGTVDRGYVVSSLRQHLLANGCLLQEDRTKATYVVEARSGGIGTDRHSLLIGIPQMTVPTFVPGQPSQIPEIPLAKKSDQQGMAKIAVFAYNRLSGRAVWQSGVIQATSSARDTWVLGTGPFQRGSVRHGTEFAGRRLPLPHFGDKDTGDEEPSAASVPVTRAAAWPEPAPLRKVPKSLTELLAQAVLDGRSPATELPAGPRNGGPAEPRPTVTPNAGGQAETEPAKVLSSGQGFKPEK